MRKLVFLLLPTLAFAQYEEQKPVYKEVKIPKDPGPDANAFKIVRPDINTWSGYKDFILRLTTVNVNELVNRAASNGSQGAKVIQKVNDLSQNLNTEVKVDESTKMDFRFNATALNAESRVYYKDVAFKTYVDPYSIVPGLYYGPYYFKREIFSKFNMLGFSSSF